MQEHSGNEKSIVWSAVDFADEEQRTEMFCARFASQDRESALCARVPHVQFTFVAQKCLSVSSRDYHCKPIIVNAHVHYVKVNPY